MSWSHFRELLPLKRPFQREFYAEICRIEGWNVRTLHERIDSMLYERTALAKQPDEVVEQELAVLRSKSEISQPLVLKDPYFLGLEDIYTLGAYSWIPVEATLPPWTMSQPVKILFTSRESIPIFPVSGGLYMAQCPPVCAPPDRYLEGNDESWRVRPALN